MRYFAIIRCFRQGFYVDGAFVKYDDHVQYRGSGIHLPRQARSPPMIPHWPPCGVPRAVQQQRLRVVAQTANNYRFYRASFWETTNLPGSATISLSGTSERAA